MNRYVPIALLALLGAAGCINASDDSVAANADVTASDGDTHSVNGSIQVPRGVKRGELTTVNGSIRVGNDATVSDAHRKRRHPSRRARDGRFFAYSQWFHHARHRRARGSDGHHRQRRPRAAR